VLAELLHRASALELFIRFALSLPNTVEDRAELERPSIDHRARLRCHERLAPARWLDGLPEVHG
jgi:hypothetical protein